MKIVKLSDNLSVSEQIALSDVAEIAARGFKTLINNRPDGEAPGQLRSHDIEAAARAVGLDYYHFPLTAQNFPGEHFDQMADLIDEPESAVLAFCRTGTRCANLWLVSRENQREVDAGRTLAVALGYDLTMADGYLSRYQG